MAVIQPLGSSNSSASNNNQINDAFRQLNREQIVKTFKQANGSNGLVQGVLPNNQGYGELLYDSDGNARIGMRIVGDVPELKVAKAGYSVLNASNDELIFNSNQDVLKVVQSASYTDTAINHTTTSPGAGGFGTDTFTIATIPHGLSYIPAMLMYIKTATGYRLMPYTDYLSIISTVACWFNWSAIVDANNITIRLNTMSYGGSSGVTGGTVFKYYLLQETAN